MKKIKAILFLIKCTFKIAIYILGDRDWNMITVNFDEKNGERLNARYRRSAEGYSLQLWKQLKNGEIDVIQ